MKDFNTQLREKPNYLTREGFYFIIFKFGDKFIRFRDNLLLMSIRIFMFQRR